MNISQLLESLKDPSVVLSVGEKLIAGFSVALLSMSVVFIVLVLIAVIIKVLQIEKTKQTPVESISNEVTSTEELSNEVQDMGELVSVITAAISAITGNSTNNILVRKIVRTNNSKSSWERISKNVTK